MNITVLGAGIVGLSTAWYLCRDGHEVTVVDRQAGVGLETSFANAGEISPSYAAPWAAPGTPAKALGWLLNPHGPFRFYPRLDPAQWRWMWQMLRQCRPSAYTRNLRRMQALALYSRDCFVAMRRDTGWRYDDAQQGTLLFFRDAAGLDAVSSDLQLLRDLGVRIEVADAAACVQIEPGLAPRRELIAGGLHMPDDETGDCLLFCRLLQQDLLARGAQFRLNTRIDTLEHSGGQLESVLLCDLTQPQAAPQRLSADATVLALGSHSPALLRPLGLYLPVYPVKGYSLSTPVLDKARAPRSSIVDEDYKVALTRLGAQIRVAGTAEIGGADTVLRPGRLATLQKVLSDLFTGGFNPQDLHFWCGLRPMTPDGPPIVGSSPLRGLYLNTGHGTFGWTMSLGSGRALADLIQGRPPDIDLQGLALDRYGHD